MTKLIWIPAALSASLLLAAQPPQDTTPAPASSPATAFVRRFSLGGRLTFPVLSQITSGDSTQNLTTGPTLIESTSEGRSTVVGGGITMQVAVGNRHAISVDLLRRKMGYYLVTQTYVGTDNTSTTTDERTLTGRKENTRASSWEIPVLFRRYSVGRFEEGPRWFWEAGASVRRLGGVVTFTEEDGVECCLQTPAHVAHRYTPGVTVGIGAQLADDYGVKIVPEFRYTRWLNRPFDTAPARSRANQLELLIGVTF